MKTWTRFPFVRLLFPFLAGILCYGWFPACPGADFWLPAIILCLLSALLLISYKIKSYGTRWLFGVVLNGFLLCLGYTISSLDNQQSQARHFSNFATETGNVYVAELIEPPAERENSYKFTVEVKLLWSGGKLFPVKGKVLAYAQKDSLVAGLGYGSEIIFSASPEPVRKPANPGEFDYARYLAVKNVFHQVYFGKGNLVSTGKTGGNRLKMFALTARNRLLETMKQNGISGHEYPVAAALLIGYDDLLDASQRQAYSGAGVVHILCVSGLHVGIVFLIADYLFFFLRKRKKAVWLRPVLIILVIWLYAVITGLAPSVLRASLMFSLITIGKSLNRQAHTYNTLAASAFILLVISPGMIYDLGFQLSYGAVAGIVTFQPHIRNFFNTTNKVYGYLWSMINVSIAAQLLVTPISIYYFHQFPNYFLIANLIAIPLSGILIYTGVIFIFLSFIPFLGKIAAAIMVVQIKLLNSTVVFIEGLPGAVSQNLYLSTFATLVLYCLLFFCFMWYLQKDRRWLYPVLMACLLLAAEHTAIAIKRPNQQMMVVHSLNRHTAIGFTSGIHQHLICDSAIISKPSILDYSLKSSRIRSGIRKISYNHLTAYCHDGGCLPGLKLFGNGFFQFFGKKGLVISPSVNLPEGRRQLKVDYVILTSNTRFKLEKLSSHFPGAHFIADASNPLRRCNSWAQEAARQGLHFYSVRESGALVIDVR
ncbi:MAG: ComEC/Rec2 family competence protein [Bacteroidota bacterium]